MDKITPGNGILNAFKSNTVYYTGKLTEDMFNDAIKTLQMKYPVNDRNFIVYPDKVDALSNIRTLKIDTNTVETFGFYKSLNIDTFRHIIDELGGRFDDIEVRCTFRFKTLFHKFMYEFSYQAFTVTDRLILDGCTFYFKNCMLYDINDRPIACGAYFRAHNSKPILLKELELDAKN